MPLSRTHIQCFDCKSYFHSKCSIALNEFVKHKNSWICDYCISRRNPLPFSTINDDELILNLTAKDNASECLNLQTSFTIQSLLDQLPGDKSDVSDDFLAKSISSKYYTPSDFIRSNFSKKPLSVMHINIASLQCHIDDLRSLLGVLGHSFDVIGISETRLNIETDPLIDISLDGYDFIETRTKAVYGGTGIYIKNGIKYTTQKELEKSEK
jgi:hypothetical protein